MDRRLLGCGNVSFREQQGKRGRWQEDPCLGQGGGAGRRSPPPPGTNSDALRTCRVQERVDPAEAGSTLARQGALLRAEVVLRLHVDRAAVGVVQGVVVRNVDVAGVGVLLIVRHLVEQVVDHQRERQVVHRAVVHAQVVRGVRAPLAGLVAGGRVNVVVAPSHVGHVVRRAADVVEVQRGGEPVDCPAHRAVGPDLGIGVVHPHRIRVAQQVQERVVELRLQF
ncbi:hypothetical protein G6F31_017395 [Rhizopus arrhizus]|nr:hypothetical protein G6F31_017395 [Rhizopus arrhizus]